MSGMPMAMQRAVPASIQIAPAPNHLIRRSVTSEALALDRMLALLEKGPMPIAARGLA
jgi:hypothetical protein